MTRRNRGIPCGRRRLREACSRKNRCPSASRQRSGAIPSSTFLGAPHDNLPAEQGLYAKGEATNGQGPVAYPCSPEVLNRHGELHVLRVAAWKADELTDDVQGNWSRFEASFPARNFAEDVPRKGAAAELVNTIYVPPGRAVVIERG